MKLDTHKLAWIAGFFDGEGHITSKRGKRKKVSDGRLVYSSVLFEVSQKDPELLYKIKDILNVGEVYGPYYNGEKPHYRYVISKFEHVQYAVAVLWDYLGNIKKKQAKIALTNYVNEPRLKPGRKSRKERYIHD